MDSYRERYFMDALFHAKVHTLYQILREKWPDNTRTELIEISIRGVAALEEEMFGDK